MTILLSRPNHDNATNYLYYWSRPVIETAKDRGASIIDLAGAKATGFQLRQRLKRIKVGVFFLNGHGLPDAVFGHDNNPLVCSTDDLTDFENSMFYVRSCNSAVILGPALVEAGAKSFIGYARKFTFGCLRAYASRPFLDPLAKLFLEPSNLIPLSMIKKNSIGESYRKSQAAMRRNLRYMLSTRATDEERYYAQFLWSNMRNQQLLGDPNAKAS